MVRPDKARNLLEVLLAALSDLRRYRSLPLERLKTDRDTQNMVLFALNLASQSAIDLALHAAADAGEPAATTYRESFHRLASAGLIDEDLATQLAGWAGLRNVLAHFYPVLDLDLVHAALTDDLGSLERFAALAAAWIDREPEPG